MYMGHIHSVGHKNEPRINVFLSRSNIFVFLALVAHAYACMAAVGHSRNVLPSSMHASWPLDLFLCLPYIQAHFGLLCIHGAGLTRVLELG